MSRISASARNDLDTPWTQEVPRPTATIRLTGAVRYVIALPAVLMLTAVIVLLVYWLR
jgi:hypothetical protein